MGKLSINLPKFTIERVLQTFSEVYDWGLRDLNIPDIHKKTLGNGIKVAVIDSGKSEHFETADAFVGAKNFSSSPFLEDKNGHATACAGIIAARKNNEGIIGVAPKAKLYFGKAMDDSGAGNPAALVKAINWAIQQKVDIMSISAGMFFDFKPLRKIIRKAHNRNIIVIAAVGNTGTRHYDVAFPARYPEVIGVAAYDQKHKVARFSSRGINVSFAMPGVNIYSTFPPNSYTRLNGTCLVGDTFIMTPDKYIKIKNLKPGNEVYSCDLDTGVLKLNVIKNIVRYKNKEVFTIKTTNNTISCTANHPFWVKRKVITDKCFYASPELQKELSSINQSFVARQCGISPSTISRFADKKRSMSLSLINQVTAKIDCDIANLEYHVDKKKTITKWARADELTTSDRILSVYNRQSEIVYELPIGDKKWNHKVPQNATEDFCRLIGFY
ncbi:MAG TPA: hypothetical protein ENH82_16280, partial [bacterium]|nr:hypothetical protein [bacterium]